MSLWNWLTRKRDDHGWPGHIINGRIRTSTVGLIVAFFVISWLHNAYQPPPPAPVVPEATQVVPPGFMPDPEYTWVPRTNVEERPRATRTTTPTTTTTSTTETTPTSPTSPTEPTEPAPTTLVDPDGPGPLPPTPVTPTSTPTTTPTTVTSPLPGPGPVPTPLAPPR